MYRYLCARLSSIGVVPNNFGDIGRLPKAAGAIILAARGRQIQSVVSNGLLYWHRIVSGCSPLANSMPPSSAGQWLLSRGQQSTVMHSRAILRFHKRPSRRFVWCHQLVNRPVKRAYDVFPWLIGG
jgi:hypothetical protein